MGLESKLEAEDPVRNVLPKWGGALPRLGPSGPATSHLDQGGATNSPSPPRPRLCLPRPAFLHAVPWSHGNVSEMLIGSYDSPAQNFLNGSSVLSK